MNSQVDKTQIWLDSDTNPLIVRKTVLKVLDDDDVTLDAVLAKLDYAHFQLKSINERVRQIEEHHVRRQ